MKILKKQMSYLATLIMLLGLCACIVGCGGKKDVVFSGSGEIPESQRTITVSVTCNQDEGHTVAFEVAEYPNLSLQGTWEYVEGKGYKIKLDDNLKTCLYTKYDEETQNMLIDYDFNLGSIGTASVELTYNNADFAKEYDGEGFANIAPVWDYTSYVMGIGGAGKLYCSEDGTFINKEEWGQGRTGTWSYDKEKDEYTFLYDDVIFTDNAESFFWMKEDGSTAEITQEELHDVYNDFMGPYTATYNEETGCYEGTLYSAAHVTGTRWMIGDLAIRLEK